MRVSIAAVCLCLAGAAQAAVPRLRAAVTPSTVRLPAVATARVAPRSLSLGLTVLGPAPAIGGAAAVETPSPKQTLIEIGGSPDGSLAARHFDGIARTRPEVSLALSRADVRATLRKTAAGVRTYRSAVGPQSPAERRLRRWLWPGVAAGALVPVLLKMAPVHFLGYLLPAALLLPLTALGLLWLYRLVRLLRGKAPAPRAAKPATWRSAAVGLALGLSLVFGAAKLEGPLVERGAAVAVPGMELRQVPGDVLEVEVMAQLQASERGRETLEGLRDRLGRVRLPVFFVGAVKETVLARYNTVLDAVIIAQDEIEERGWTVDQFLASAALQREFAAEFQYTFAHELTHANQARRALFQPGQFKAHFDLEWEYEAFLEEHYVTHQRLLDDPETELTSGDLDNYTMAIASLDGFLANIRSRDSYKKLPHSKDPYFKQYFAKLRAAWPAHQLEGNVLLGRRWLDDKPLAAAGYLEKALALSDSLKLPAPEVPALLVQVYRSQADSVATARPWEARNYLDKALAVSAKYGLPAEDLRARKVETYVREARAILERDTVGDGIFYVAGALDAAEALAPESEKVRSTLAELRVRLHVRLAQYWRAQGHPGYAELELEAARRFVKEHGLPDSLVPPETTRTP